MTKKIIHYSTGGFIPGEEMRKKGVKAKFSTLCGKSFPTGGSDIMQSGYTGKLNTTCKACLKKLNTHTCSICFAPYEGMGNNAYPVNEGRCCDSCNNLVIVARINKMRMMQKVLGGKK